VARYLLLGLLFVSVTAYAATSLRIGSKVLTTGGSAPRVQELLGPLHVCTFLSQETDGRPKNQMRPGEQWQYGRGGKTIVITIINRRAINFETP
jgi:hypothetical protein